MRYEDWVLYQQLMRERYGPLEKLERERIATPSSEPPTGPATSSMRSTATPESSRNSTGAPSVETTTTRHRVAPEPVPIPNPEGETEPENPTASEPSGEPVDRPTSRGVSE